MAPPTLTHTPLTELDAVNVLLLSIGKSPVNTLSVSGISDVNIARLVLHNTLRDVLTKGWHFNVDECYPMTRDANGKIEVPANVLSFDPEDRSKDYVQRLDSTDSKLRLYDRKNHTFVLPADVKVRVTWFLTFGELPAAARAYITCRAGRAFQANVVGSDILYRFTKEAELEALQLLEQEELDSGDRNFFTGDYATHEIVYREH